MDANHQQSAVAVKVENRFFKFIVHMLCTNNPYHKRML